MLNSTLLQAATKVIAKTDPALWVIHVKFFNTTPGSTFAYYLPMFDSLTYDRSYNTNFGDVIDLEARISLKDFAILQDQGVDLRCLVTFSYAKDDGAIISTPSPIQKEYVVYINNPRDIRKATTDVQEYVEPSYPISIRLVEETVYKLRQTRINTVFQVSTIKEAILTSAHQLGIERIHLVDPDNTHVYDHIVLASAQGISSLYNYLQSMCGIYCKGVNYYITDGVLYIYPPFETDPTYDKTTIFYQVDLGRFGGKNSYHATSGLTTSVVINREVHSYDLTVSGAENAGTGFIFNRASRSLDGYTTTGTDHGAAYNPDQSLMVTLNTDRTAMSNSNNIHRIKNTDNPFPKMSEIVASMASLATFEWPGANPFLMDPCQKILFYYDKSGIMAKKTGIMEFARYRFSRVQRVGDKYVYGCAAAVGLRLAPNETAGK